MDAGILPVKRLDRAKGRLADAFDHDTRVRIARALFDDALDLAGSVDFLKWWVVSDDPAVLEKVTERGLETISDPGEGLNSALVHAVETVVAAGATSATIVPVDVPLAWRGDLEDLLDTGATSDVVVVPSEGDGGTNGLYLSPPEAIPPRFGPASLAAHVAEAGRLGLRCAILSLPRLGLDIDTAADLDAFVKRHRQGAAATAAVIKDLPRVPPPTSP